MITSTIYNKWLRTCTRKRFRLYWSSWIFQKHLTQWIDTIYLATWQELKKIGCLLFGAQHHYPTFSTESLQEGFCTRGRTTHQIQPVMWFFQCITLCWWCSCVHKANFILCGGHKIHSWYFCIGQRPNYHHEQDWILPYTHVGVNLDFLAQHNRKLYSFFLHLREPTTTQTL
jgi:hypothetical protein